MLGRRTHTEIPDLRPARAPRSRQKGSVRPASERPRPTQACARKTHARARARSDGACAGGGGGRSHSLSAWLPKPPKALLPRPPRPPRPPKVLDLLEGSVGATRAQGSPRAHRAPPPRGSRSWQVPPPQSEGCPVPGVISPPTCIPPALRPAQASQTARTPRGTYPSSDQWAGSCQDALRVRTGWWWDGQHLRGGQVDGGRSAPGASTAAPSKGGCALGGCSSHCRHVTR